MKYLVILCLALAACAKDEVQEVREKVKNTAYAQGTAAADTASYSTACASATLPDVGPIKFPGVKTQYDLSSLDFTKKRVYYTDSECTKAGFTVEEKGKVSITGKSTIVADAVDEDFNFEHTTVTIQSETLVAVFNLAGICGITDWALDNQRDVSVQSALISCPGKPSPRVAPEVVLIEGNVLYLGQETDSAVRPTKVDRGVMYIKK